MRLDKFLCDMGMGTRSQVKKDIKNGNVTVDGEIATKPETKVIEGVSQVTYFGENVVYEKYEYYMFHKPAGCVTATTDRNDKTVMDYFEDLGREGFFPVGRLDKDTEGLLIITNDGEYAHNMLSPKKHVEKVYYAKVKNNLQEDAVKRFEEGIDIGDDKPTLPAKLEIVQTTNKTAGETADEATAENEAVITEVLITIKEGRFHQVKRMVAAVGGEVIYLKRLSMGNIVLDESLAPGEYKKISINNNSDKN